MNEKELTREVAEMAKDFGWARYHTHRSDFSPAGWPDEVLLRDERLVIAELKSDVGKPSPKQQEWLDALKRVEQVEAYLWRPADMDEITRLLLPPGYRVKGR